MDLLSLISGGSENLYKYLFMGGILLVIVALWYPKEKEFELKKVQNEYVKKLKLSNYELAQFETQLEEFRIKDSLNLRKKSSAEYVNLKARYKDIMKDTIEISFYKNLVSIQENQVSWYNRLYWICLLPGILLIFLGAICWHGLMGKIYTKANN